MNWQPALIEGRFIKRFKRFFAEVEINGQIEIAHVPNTGSLKSCLLEGAPCMVQPADNPERKLKFTLQMIKTPTSWVGVNTANPAKIVAELVASRQLSRWSNYDCHQFEVPLNDESRVDLVLWNSAQSFPQGYKLTKKDVLETDKPLHFVELKNVTYAENGRGMFPDSVTTRGQKHLRELMELKARKHTAEMLFVVQREDCQSFGPAHEIDPKYAELFWEAQQSGVEITVLACKLSPQELTITVDPITVTRS